MNSQNTEHLILMANQIASNMAHGCSDEEAQEKVKTHITLFWALAMRKNLCEDLEGIKDQLHAIAYGALGEIRSAL